MENDHLYLKWTNFMIKINYYKFKCVQIIKSFIDVQILCISTEIESIMSIMF